jgi:hypothetical protein
MLVNRYVVGHDAANVSDDVRIAVGQAQHLEDVHPAVHACNHCQLSPWMNCQVLVGVPLDVSGVVGEQFIGAGLEDRVTVCGHDRTVVGQ